MTGDAQFDRTDPRLLAEIQQHGRATNAELAARVNLSPSACLRRVQRLESEGVIAGYGARLEPRQIG
ncbi:Lrp/AsnC family transcriptional regulator, partial [Dryocola clanedunensis]